jgi:uncharacterized protein
MDLREQINKDLNEAFKGREELKVSVLRMLTAALLNKEKEKRYKISKENSGMEEKELAEKSGLSDEEIIDVISSEVKKRKESAQEYEKAGRTELAEKEKKETEILQKYLPEQLSEEEVKKIVQEAIEQAGAKDQKDMGKVMGALMPKVKGKADGGLVSKIVKELLTS